MLKIGITGGIGSGKTTVCHLFETLHIPVYYADDAAKWLMNNNADLIIAIKNAFGSDVYNDQNQLQRTKLASIVFSNANARKLLESLVHPAVEQHNQQWIEQHKNAPYVLKEAALVFESGSYKHLDKVITVTAPLELRISRVTKRDNATVEQVKARIAAQMPDEEKIRLSDFVIYNNEQQMLIPQVMHIHEQIMQQIKA
jgi:dephospho-CoA kinase